MWRVPFLPVPDSPRHGISFHRTTRTTDPVLGESIIKFLNSDARSLEEFSRDTFDQFVRREKYEILVRFAAELISKLLDIDRQQQLINYDFSLLSSTFRN